NEEQTETGDPQGHESRASSRPPHQIPFPHRPGRAACLRSPCDLPVMPVKSSPSLHQSTITMSDTRPKEDEMLRARTMVTAVASAAALLAAGCSGGGSQNASQPEATGPGGQGPSTSSPYHVTINPADFTANVNNPWFPLTPGTTFVYRGTKDGKPS